MPIYKKLEISFYILLWVILTVASVWCFYFLGLDLYLSILFGFFPWTLLGVYLIYLFYPGFDPFPSVKYDNSKKLVSLTFDDGPTPGFTDRILDILKQTSTTATFFMVGSKIEKNPNLALKVITLGHEAGIHTYDHKKLHFCNYEEIEDQSRKTWSLIESIYRKANIKKPCKIMFRSPHGFKNFSLKRYLNKNNIALIPWTRGVWDTDSPGCEWIFNKATKKPKNNEILLLHDGMGIKNDIFEEQINGVLQALPKIIDFYRNKGYRFVKVSDFIRNNER
jgi:peptidoglycan/xylan/chitin deacetylase (PgdA/CDA1 family)